MRPLLVPRKGKNKERNASPHNLKTGQNVRGFIDSTFGTSTFAELQVFNEKEVKVTYKNTCITCTINIKTTKTNTITKGRHCRQYRNPYCHVLNVSNVISLSWDKCITCKMTIDTRITKKVTNIKTRIT